MDREQIKAKLTLMTVLSSVIFDPGGTLVGYMLMERR
jgi:hypothetical protein